MNAPFDSPLLQRARSFVRPSVTHDSVLLTLPRFVGRLAELSEEGWFGAVSWLCGLLQQAQAQEEQTAWVSASSSIFYPPDLAFRGLDIEAITVVRAPEARVALGAAEELLRCGAFGVVVVDGLGPTADEGVLGRLARLAEDRQVALIFLTRKKPTDPSLGTQVSLRACVTLVGENGIEVSLARDKRSGPLTRSHEAFHGPFGLY